MSLLREYLVNGRSVREMAAEHGVDEALVRAALARAGIRIGPGEVRDPVCAAVGWLGFESFAVFAQRHGTDTFHRQATLLGVSHAALKRVHDIYRCFAVAEAQADDAEPQRT